MASNFNVTPYYDDYDVNSGYLKILFKPGNSVQARELTQIQSILQQQIANISDHFFKEGAMVIPGQSAIDTDVSFVKIKQQGSSTTYNAATDFRGKIIVGLSTGIRALVVHTEAATGQTATDDPDTLFVKYIGGGNSSVDTSNPLYDANVLPTDFVEGSSIQFQPGEVLTTEGTDSSYFACEVRPSSENSTGLGSISFIESGIYYIQNHLVVVPSQKIVLDKYSNSPSYKIGLQVNESFVNSNTDSSLLDNAQGTTNFNSPGADRYRISLVLSKRAVDEVDTSNFIELISVRNGVVESHVRTTEYSVIEETLARRTYDESGDYSVRPYKIDIRELLNEDNNRGVTTFADYSFDNELDAKEMARTRFYDDLDMISLDGSGNGLAHIPTPNDISNYPERNLDSSKYYPGRTHDSLTSALKSRLAIGIEPGKSYVKGYEIENLVTQFVDYKKSRDHIQKNNEYLTSNLGNCIYVTDLSGLPLINQKVNLLNTNVNGINYVEISRAGTEVVSAFTESTQLLNSNFSSWDTSNTRGVDVIGTARIKYVESFTTGEGFSNSIFGVDGDSPTSSTMPAIYKVYLYDIQMEINPRTGSEYLLSDLRALEDRSNDSIDFNANTLVEYSLIDQSTDFTVGNVIINAFGNDFARGVVYHSNSNKILVKSLGAGNTTITTTSKLTSRLFQNNEVLREIYYGSGTLLSGTSHLYERTNANTGRILSKNIIFDADGSGLVPIGSDFVKTVRFVDDDSGNTTIDTSYTVQKFIEGQTVDSDGIARVNLGDNSSQTFPTESSRYFFASQGPSGSGVGEESKLLTPVITTKNANGGTTGRKTIAEFDFSAMSSPPSVVNLFVTVIKSGAGEKLKELQQEIIFPYARKLTDGSNVTVAGAEEGLDADLYASNTVGGLFDQSATDSLGNSLSLSSVQLDHSDVFELVAVYDTCNVNNISYQVSGNQIKTYDSMTAEDFKFALDVYNAYEDDTIADWRSAYGFLSTDPDPVKIKDITSQYLMDNGQRPSVYNLGSIQSKPDQPVCSGRIIIIYSYFSHTSGGDYFSVDSYVHNTSGVTYDQIPSFENNRLSDVLDFRPAVTSVPTTSSDQSPIKKSSLTTSANTPIDNDYIITDYRYYLPRKDKIYLSKDGDFEVKYGASSTKPDYPDDPSDGMVIYKLDSEAYTLNKSSVTAEMIDNKRYTMRDIGRLEKRIKQIEYYTSLSLLEKETKDMEILDSNGLDRFKNGFVVEPFTGHNIGDVFDSEYRCSIDIIDNELRPLFNEKNVRMEFNQSESSSYSIKDGLITLPVSSYGVLSSQDKSSRTIEVNPYSASSFKGQIKLIPDQDDWRDTKNPPEVTDSNVGGSGEGYKNSENNTAPIHPETQLTGGGGGKSTGEIRNSQSTETINPKNNSGNLIGGITMGNSGTANTTRTGDKETLDSIIPFIRARNIFFHGTGLKPNTKVFAYFDGYPVTNYCSTVEKVLVSVSSGYSQDFIKNHESDIIANIGEISLTNNLGHEVRIVGIQFSTSNELIFYVLNNIDSNTFTTGQALFLSGPDTISGISPGSFSGTTGAGSVGSLVTDSVGSIRGIFSIPNTEQLRFRTGNRIFRLSDSQVYKADNSTEAEGVYSATGNLGSKYTSTRPNNYSTLYTSPNGSVRTQVESSGNRFNPIAQTFSTDKLGGAFISSVDLYFSNKDTSGIPVSLELRNTVGGYPGKDVLARKTLVSDLVTEDPVGIQPTNFEFDSPVHIEQGVEYSLVVIADSSQYFIHVARMGSMALDGSGLISKQPYSGVLYKAASTAWAPELKEDLKFKINQAKFQTSTSSILYFQNKSQDTFGYATNKIELESGSLELVGGGLTVRIHAKNHGLVPKVGQSTHYYVNIGGFLETSKYGSDNSADAAAARTYITGADLNGTHEVVSTQINSFDISLSSPKFVNGSVVAYEGTFDSLNIPPGRFNPVADSSGKATVEGNSKYDILIPLVEDIQLPQTNLAYSLKTISGYSQDSDGVIGVKDSSWSSFTPNLPINFETPRSVYSSTNESSFSIGASSFEKKSLVYKVVLSSTNENISPVIDTRRFSSALTSNVINYPGTGSSDDSEENAYILSESNFNGGLSESKYITREIKLSQPATSIKVVLSMHKPFDSDIDIFYKIKTSDIQEYRKLNYVKIPSPDGYGQSSSSSLEEFVEFEYDVENTSEFSSFGIKIVLRGKNSADVPRVKDLRIIALAN